MHNKMVTVLYLRKVALGGIEHFFLP